MNSFKVLCIHDRWIWSTISKKIEAPQVGDEDVVIDTYQAHGKTYYALERFGMENVFLSTYFVVLPSDDEIAAEEEGAELDRQFRDLILEVENA